MSIDGHPVLPRQSRSGEDDPPSRTTPNRLEPSGSEGKKPDPRTRSKKGDKKRYIKNSPSLHLVQYARKKNHYTGNTIFWVKKLLYIPFFCLLPYLQKTPVFFLTHITSVQVFFVHHLLLLIYVNLYRFEYDRSRRSSEERSRHVEDESGSYETRCADPILEVW